MENTFENWLVFWNLMYYTVRIFYCFLLHINAIWEIFKEFLFIIRHSQGSYLWFRNDCSCTFEFNHPLLNHLKHFFFSNDCRNIVIARHWRELAHKISRIADPRTGLKAESHSGIFCCKYHPALVISFYHPLAVLQTCQWFTGCVFPLRNVSIAFHFPAFRFHFSYFDCCCFFGLGFWKRAAPHEELCIRVQTWWICDTRWRQL